MGAALASGPAPGQAGQTMPAGGPDSSAAAGMGVDAQTQQSNQVLRQISALGQQTKVLMDLVPTASDEVAQIQELLKAIVVKVAAGGPMANGSGMQVPANGGGA